MSIFHNRHSTDPRLMEPGKQIARDVWEEMLDDAFTAPTHKLTQPWRFHAFVTEVACQKLQHGVEALWPQVFPDGGCERKKEKVLARIARASGVVAILAKLQPEKLPEWEERAAVSAAVQNFLLSSTQRGLVTFWSTSRIFCGPEFREWLGADATHVSMGVVYVGYPADNWKPKHRRRVPLVERVVFVE